MADKTSADSIISLPAGGGALRGMGETFSPDLHSGTGNFAVPIDLPPGRNDFQPKLSLVYSTGHGNGLYGLGWAHNIAGISRKTSKGVPRFLDAAPNPNDRDVFILSGAEDLLELGDISDESGVVATQYRPRTEGIFAEILHYRNAAGGGDYWRVRTKDGLTNYYGTNPNAGEHPDYSVLGARRAEPAVIRNPNADGRPFAWKLTLTKDAFGNRIEYLYQDDFGEDNGRNWEQPIIRCIRYGDYGSRATPKFLITVTFEYEDRPDPFSEYRAGFEIRTTKRCKSILVETHADRDHKVRRYECGYASSSLNGLSLLVRVQNTSFDDAGVAVAEMPPLEFGYSEFRPQQESARNFYPLTGSLPPTSLANPNLAVVDLFGRGLPDIVEINGSCRHWRNLGGGKFAPPKSMPDAPAGFGLADPGVQLLDADGDGRTDLLVTRPGISGYFPLRFGATWDRASMRKYRVSPTFDLQDPEVRLLDLTGDGATDAIRSGTRLECFFNNPETGWESTRWVERQPLDKGPNVSFSDPRVKVADMSGDGLHDIVLVHSGSVQYWANMGHGNWSSRVSMRNCPHLPFGYDPRRILIGDVNGDGAADFVYVADGAVHLWINRSGNSWSDEIVIPGTPPVSDMDAVRLCDLLGSGVSGILWTRDAASATKAHYFFLDLTGGTKPYLLTHMENNLGAVTEVTYRPSTEFYLQDEQSAATRWRTPLPFPVQVVSQVQAIDQLSQGKRATEYRYHGGYWAGDEKEVRGFSFVEQLNSESFEKFHARNTSGSPAFADIDRDYFSPPTLTKTWFHQGAVEDENGDWSENYPADAFWQGDPHLLNHPGNVLQTLLTLATRNAELTAKDRRQIERDALRALQGNVLRTELYALDGSVRELRPYTVTESAFDVREEATPADPKSDRRRIFFPHLVAQRSTQWERGDDPLTAFTFPGAYDAFGQPVSQSAVSVPRRSVKRLTLPGAGVADETRILATHSRTQYAAPSQGIYIHDRVATATSFTLRNPAGVTESNPNDTASVLQNQYSAAAGVHSNFEAQLQAWLPQAGEPAAFKIYSHSVHRYDGNGFVGLQPGSIGKYGAVSRRETLIITDAILSDAYGASQLIAPDGKLARTNGVPANYNDELGYRKLTGAGYVTGLYTAETQQQFDFQVGAAATRGRLNATRDRLDREFGVVFDAYDALPSSVTDPVGLTKLAEYDYRTLKVSLLTDANGNRTKFEYSPFGLLTATWLLGKPAVNEGDRNRASMQYQYNLLAFRDSKAADPTKLQPVFVKTIRYTHHDTDPDDTGDTIETREYSDGFARSLQKRSQAEDTIYGDPLLGGGDALLPLDQNDPGPQVVAAVANMVAAKPNVIVSGWQRYDNKGRVVEKREPFIDQGWEFSVPASNQLGQKAAMYYDPRGRATRTLFPDSSEQRVVYGKPKFLDDPVSDNLISPTPWEAFTYDTNDNAGRTHSSTTTAYRHHWNTPSSVLIDSLGQKIMAVARTRDQPASATAALPPLQEFSSFSTFDIQGNLLSVTDALGRLSLAKVYDLAKRALKGWSIDGGTRLTVPDAQGNEIARRDEKGALTLRSFDALNRPTAVRARSGSGQSLTLREQLIYGDGSDKNQPQAERDASRDSNRLGAVYRNYDEAGLTICSTYDFGGNLLEKERRVLSDQTLLAGLQQISGRAISGFTVDWETSPALDANQSFATSSLFDALNRAKRVTYPSDVNGHRPVLACSYNRAGALAAVVLDGAAYVSRIAYNARGQRVLVAYGNGVMTRYAYDAKTFRLARLRSEGFTQLNAGSYRRQGAPVQDSGYSYDLTGNLLGIAEQVAGCGIHGSSDGDDVLTRAFGYDPLYRLTRATGRESNTIGAPRPWTDDARQGFNSGRHGTPNQDNAPTQTQAYWESYDYDPAGNMMSMRHGTGTAGVVAWTRQFGIGGFRPQDWRAKIDAFIAGGTPAWGAEGNRLTNAGTNIQTTTHQFDVNGNLVEEFTNRLFAWDHADRLIAFADQPAGAAAATTAAIYLYDAAGKRIKKLVTTSSNVRETTVYIDGAFEYRLRHDSGGDLECNLFHLMDDKSRLAVIRTGDVFPGDGAPDTAYHLNDQLGSSFIVVGGADATASSFINREEYHPYGETSFGSYGRKRYRFTGKERDEESGLCYHGARYYAAPLARWISIDPAARDNARFQTYCYCECRPVSAFDPDGKNPILIGILIALFLLPNTANAPGPNDPLYPSMSEGEFIVQFSLMYASMGVSGLVERKMAYHIGESMWGRVASGATGGMAGGGVYGGGTVAVNDMFTGRLSSPQRYGAAIALGMFFGAALGGLQGRFNPAPAQLSDRAMLRYLMKTYEQTPVLQELSDIWLMEANTRGRMEAMKGVLARFEAETGIKVEFVKSGAVQTATGEKGNLASFHSRPGYLQIERSVGMGEDGANELLNEITHELSYYYVQRAWSYEAWNAAPGAVPELKPNTNDFQRIHGNFGNKLMDDIVSNEGESRMLNQ